MTQRFTWSPSPGPSQSIQPKVREAQFGDGYGQRVGAGINNAPRTLTLDFTGPTARIEAIDAFLKARNGVETFDFLAPDGADGKWLCKSWTRTIIHRNVQSIGATFEEKFGD